MSGFRALRAATAASALFFSTCTIGAAQNAGPFSWPGERTWLSLKPALATLANRPTSLDDVIAGGAPVAPQMRGAGGASRMFGTLGGIRVMNEDESRALIEWVSARGGHVPFQGPLVDRYMKLLNAGEAELRRRGLPVDSAGSALDFAIENAYEIALGPQPPSDVDRRTLHGTIVAMLALAAGQGALGDARDREYAYQKLLIPAEALREGALEASGDDPSYRDAAAAQLRGFGIDPKNVPLGALICIFAGTQPCSKVRAEARPVLDELADRYPY